MTAFVGKGCKVKLDQGCENDNDVERFKGQARGETKRDRRLGPAASFEGEE